MSWFRLFVVVGALVLCAFFAWPWVSDLFAEGALSGEISVQAGGVSAQIPAAIGLFGTLGLAAMLWMVRR